MPHCNAVRHFCNRYRAILKFAESSASFRGKRASLRTIPVFDDAIEKSVRFDDPDQVARIGVVELEARALVQHVGVDPVRPQQRNPLLALRALPFQPRQFRRQRDDLLRRAKPLISKSDKINFENVAPHCTAA